MKKRRMSSAAATLTAGNVAQNMAFNNVHQGYQQDYRGWTNPFPNQPPAGQDSAYQRLPVNHRRRNLKRERPSDFLEVGGSDGQAKVPRYWE